MVEILVYENLTLLAPEIAKDVKPSSTLKELAETIELLVYKITLNSSY